MHFNAQFYTVSPTIFVFLGQGATFTNIICGNITIWWMEWVITLSLPGMIYPSTLLTVRFAAHFILGYGMITMSVRVRHPWDPSQGLCSLTSGGLPSDDKWWSQGTDFYIPPSQNYGSPLTFFFKISFQKSLNTGDKSHDGVTLIKHWHHLMTNTTDEQSSRDSRGKITWVR